MKRPPSRRTRPVLTLSHSSMTTFAICPELYNLKYNGRLANSGAGSGTSDHDKSFGLSMHAALATLELSCDIDRAKKVLASSWREPLDADHRTLDFAEDLLIGYAEEWERFQPATLLSETTLVSHVGEVDHYEVRFGGTLDLIVLTPSSATVIDFKTSRLGWPNWWGIQRVSDQWPGYTFLVQGSTLCGKRRPGVLVRYIYTAKSVPDYVDRFRETLVLSDEHSLGEWKRDTLAMAREIIECHKSGVWRHSRTACGWQFGRQCEFYDHCILPPDSRGKDLKTNGSFVPRLPSPTETNVRLGLT